MSQGATFEGNADFIPLGHQQEAPANSNGQAEAVERRRVDPRERHDRPKTKHALPGYEPWVLVKTKLGRRFVHNTDTKQSFWRIPGQVKVAIEAFDDAAEKDKNAQWAEQQLQQMREAQAARGRAELEAVRKQRRRSESLQREDEEAMLAELAAEDGEGKQDGAAAQPDTTEPRGYLGEASDSEYEYVEVTDSEGEHDDVDEQMEDAAQSNDQDEAAEEPLPDPGPVEFGEDDIAYQLAMMGEAYGLEPEEYGIPDDEDAMDEEEDIGLSNEEATALFYEMLEEHNVSPFTPWDKLIADDSSTSIVLDARYTLLPSSKARKEAWDVWSREQAARVQAERAAQEKQDPKIPFLRFLESNASTKLYWPEFKRKFKREPELNDRALQDKDREKLYRELVAKLKLPESKRRDELQSLLKVSLQGEKTIPNKVLVNPVFYSLSASSRAQALSMFGLSASTS